MKLAENHPKAKVIIHEDYESYPPELLEQLKGATGCVWAQGISSVGVKEEEYTKITVDYPWAAAKAFSGLSEQMNFVYISGEGANMDETKGGQLYARVKGRAERQLLKLAQDRATLNVFNLRPAVINPQGNYLQERAPKLYPERISTGLGSVLNVVWKSKVISTDALARVCVDLAVGDGSPLADGKGVDAEGRLLGNVALRRLAGV